MCRKKLLFSFIGALLLAPSLHSQTIPADLDNLLKNTLDSMRALTNAKSFSAAMQFPDGSVWAHADGISAENPQTNVTTADAYLIGSVTKTITSACILQLADEGVLSIDDSLSDWVPSYPFINPNITIKQLLNHTSGIYDVLSAPGQQEALLQDISKIWTPEELIETFIGPPLFPPGAAWSYSNTNYFLLGMIIEAATGNPFYVEIRNRFYTPQGLTTFAIPAFESINSPIAHVWLDITGDNITDDAHDFYMAYLSLNSTAGAAGGYFSTPSDCTKWMRTYMRGDLLSVEMMDAAKTTVNAPGSQGGKYGLGLMRNSFLGNLAYGHGGDLAYAASSWYFPEKDVSITVFTNDSKKTSWDLLPVVRELLRTCEAYEPVSGVSDERAIEGVKVAAYPNPFVDGFSVSVNLPNNADEISMTLSNALGQNLQSIEQRNLPLGETNITFSALEDLVPGVYFVSLRVNGVQSQIVKVFK